MTALHYCFQFGYDLLGHYLISKGASAGSVARQCSTLNLTVERTHAGANPNLQNAKGLTPMQLKRSKAG
jgi:hypothetical protein